MPSALQMEFCYSSLDLPGRSVVTVVEIAEKLGYSVQHIINAVDAGELVACNLALGTSKRSLRVPIEEYRAWIMRHLTAPASKRTAWIDGLSHSVKLELHAELSRRLYARTA